MPTRRAALEDNIDEGKQEQPNHVNEVPVPCCRFETEMLLRAHLTGRHAKQAYQQEDGADDDVCPVEAGRHEE